MSIAPSRSNGIFILYILSSDERNLPVLQPSDVRSRRTALFGLMTVAIALSTGNDIKAAETSIERILTFGDSQAQGLAGGLIRLYRGDRLRRVLDRAKIGTGLIPRPNYDWPVQACVVAAGGEHPDIAVALFGANDRPPIRSGGSVEPRLLQPFTERYGDRVAEVARCFVNADIPLIWLGHPVVRDPVINEDVDIMNAIYEERSSAEGAVFVSTSDLFKGLDGSFAAYGKGIDGQTTKLRADDGIHMTPAGYDVLTAAVVPVLDQYRKS